jgi:DNA-damage-inducible protein D
MSKNSPDEMGEPGIHVERAGARHHDKSSGTKDKDKETAKAATSMTDPNLSGHISPFEAIRLESEEGVEYWSARDLSKVLGYTKWDKFLNAIQRAEVACENSGQDVADHFQEATKIVSLGKGAKREVEDVHMSRYGCYLLVQNADPTKPAVAMGQTYFAVQTRRQEEADVAEALLGMSEDQRRLYLRGEITVYNRRLADAAQQAGVLESRDFAIFNDHGYRGLYGGLGTRDIHRRKGLKPSQHILDHMGSEELGANIFRITQTEAKLRIENVQGKQAANQTHFEVGRKVRQTIRELGTALPEDLPPPKESVKQLQREHARQIAQAQLSDQNSQLPQSEQPHQAPLLPDITEET